jgi:hypothetical protein
MSAAEVPQASTLVAVLRRPCEGEPSRHYVGLPPMEAGEPDTRERMAVPRVLVLETRPDGIFLDRYDQSGDEAGDTWHQSIDDAKEQAAAEYGENLGPWTEVPDSEDDPVAFALRLAGADT